MKKDIKNEPIDVVIPWVDGNDPEWNKERKKYVGTLDYFEKESNSDTRFESWDNLKYIFRGIETCMPWVNKVFLITYGHIPDFLNIDCPKLRVIKHSDYIPTEYLPTFNSNTIEINYHRINELSENFILFNDDLFPLKEVSENYYFKNNLICDEAVERALCPSITELDSRVNMYRCVNNMIIINKYFDKRKVQKKHFFKWYNLKYGKKLMRTISLHHYFDFDYFSIPHMACPMKKSVIAKLWELEPEVFHISSMNRFRSYSDVSQYVFRFWTLCEGKFNPRRTKGIYVNITDNNCDEIVDIIKQRKEIMLVLNEEESLKDFHKAKEKINAAFEEIFPNKSSYEI